MVAGHSRILHLTFWDCSLQVLSYPTATLENRMLESIKDGVSHHVNCPDLVTTSGLAGFKVVCQVSNIQASRQTSSITSSTPQDQDQVNTVGVNL